MPRHLDRIFAISGTLTFLIGWAFVIYLMFQPTSYFKSTGTGAGRNLQIALGYGPGIMMAATLQWALALYAHSLKRQAADNAGSN